MATVNLHLCEQDLESMTSAPVFKDGFYSFRDVPLDPNTVSAAGIPLALAVGSPCRH